MSVEAQDYFGTFLETMKAIETSRETGKRLADDIGSVATTELVDIALTERDPTNRELAIQELGSRAVVAEETE